MIVDAAMLGTFFDAMFRHADENTFISLRAFFDDKKGVFSITGIKLTSDPAPLLKQIEAFANRCAAAPNQVVFCPPIATFTNRQAADEESLANGLALSVECDKAPYGARLKLEQLLGPSTVVVASGGEWTDPETGEIQAKLHLHWRLSEPTRGEEHDRLKHARILATRLVGGDNSNKTIVHPIRWPGSWHRKGTPRLASIVLLTDRELDLDEALERLQDAAAAANCDGDDQETDAGASPHAEGNGEERDTAELIRALLTAEDYHAPIVTLAMRMLRGGMPDAQVVLHIRGMMQAVPAEQRDRKDGVLQQGRWQARYDDIPRAVSTARSKLGPAPTPDPAKSASGAWGQPIDFFSDPNSAAPVLRPDHVPDVIYDFAVDAAERMGVDPTSLAMAGLASSASVVTDDWRVQPKRHDYTWTEQPRLWVAILGDPSILKSPVISAASRPIDKLEAKANQRHREAMRIYSAQVKAAKKDKSGGTPEPPHPLRDRYIIEGATVEAISEILRDDEAATQRAPAGKVLARNDEMSEFFANLDRYKSGGKGGGDRGAYLRMFNGGVYTVDRVLRGAFSIPNWSACFLGGMQPGPIQRIAKDTDEDGLLQRFMYAVPGPQQPGVDCSPCRDAQERYNALFPALVALAPPRVPGEDHAQVVSFHPDAHQHRERVDTLARAMALMPDTSPRLKSSYGKWPGMYARLALIFHLIGIADVRSGNPLATIPNTLEITEATAKQAALFMIEILQPHLLRADALMFTSVQTNHAERIAGWILLHKLARVTARDVVRNYKPFASPEDRPAMNAVMERLVLVNWLEPEVPSNPMKPVHSWLVNPAVHVKFEGYSEREQERRRTARDAIQAAMHAFDQRQADKDQEP